MAIVRKSNDSFLQGESAIKALQSYINGTEISREGMYLLQIINSLVHNEKEVYQRIPSEVFGGLAEGGRRNVQASALCRAEGSPDETKQAPVLPSGYTREQEIIGQWAERDGCWSDTPEKDQEKSGRKHQDEFDGAEARIFYDGKGRVYKTVDYIRYPNLQRFLDRITIHNAYFPECPMTVEGFGMRDYADDNTGFCVVISQPFVKGETPTQEQIERSLHERGLVDPAFGMGVIYESPSHNILVTDVHDMNCVLTAEGRVAFFDCEAHINNIAGFGGRYEIPPLQFDEKAVEEIKDFIGSVVPLEVGRDWIRNNISSDWQDDAINDIAKYGQTNGEMKTIRGDWVIIQKNPMDKDIFLVTDTFRLRKMLSVSRAPLDDGTVLSEDDVMKLSMGDIVKNGNRFLSFDLDKGRIVEKNDMTLRLSISPEKTAKKKQKHQVKL